MSSKATIFLTKDNEHCYDECNTPAFEDGKFIGFTIVLEMSKKNITVVTNDSEDLVIEIKPGSELYSLIKNMRNW